MSKPTDIPEWGSDETNNTEPDASHKQDGWGGSNKLADSGMMNWILWVLWKWIVFLDGLFGDNGVIETSNTRWQILQPVGPIAVHVTNAAAEGYGILSSGTNPITDHAICTNPCVIDLRVGDRITAIKCTIAGDGTTQDVVVKLERQHLSGTTIVSTAIDTITVSNPSTGQNASHTLSSPYTVADGDAFFWHVDIPADDCTISKVGITKDRLNG